MTSTDTLAITANHTSRYLYPKSSPKLRMFALWYFGILIGVWTIAGHTYLGFEQSWTAPVAAVVTSFAMTIIIEWARAWSAGQVPRFMTGFQGVASLLLPVWPPALAVAMLLYPGDRVWPIVFAIAVAIASKSLFRVPYKGGTKHIFNPSNFGAVVTLFLFPAVGIAPPYHFVENLSGMEVWVLTGLLLASGVYVNYISTGRLVMCVAWIAGFVGQAYVRSLIGGSPILPYLMPMTSAAFILFTMYMITDPGTSPLEWKGQIAFGFGCAAIYGTLQMNHIVYGLFLSLSIICFIRGMVMWASNYMEPASIDKAVPCTPATGGVEA